MPSPASEESIEEEERYIQENSEEPPSTKRRRLQGACDACRRKKIKCDSSKMPGKICSNCTAFDLDCTHTPRAKDKESQSAYIKLLEERLNKMEVMLRSFRPDVDILQQVDAQPEFSPREKAAARLPSSHIDLHYPGPKALSAQNLVAGPSSQGLDVIENDDDLSHIALQEKFGQMSVEAVAERFFGQSSAFQLAQEAMQAQDDYTGRPDTSRGRDFRRPGYWDIRPWELAYAESETTPLVYPPNDLMESLIYNYFTRVNVFIPLLHRPSFERSLREGLQFKDRQFGSTVLMVCAIGSRYSPDPRVFLDGETELSCGWKYFSQISVLPKATFYKSSLYSVQHHVLSVFYLIGTSVPHAAWNILGIALRLIMEKGVHRRLRGNHKLTVETELWKRAFWCLLAMDRAMSSFLGRPSAIQEEDFDLDFPVECDDEYWENPDPELAFKQPPGKPSFMACFISQLKLCEIHAFALRTLYSTRKSKALSGLVGGQWEQRVVAELDSAMNKWIDSVPEHLRWDPLRENMLFFDQSAYLHAMYYHVHIQIHRPFLHTQSVLTFPSFAICSNAARACSHLLDVHARRVHVLPLPHTLIAAFTSGIVLLLNLWEGRHRGLTVDPSKEMADVQICMMVIKTCERRWHVAGRLWDMLHELAFTKNLPQPPVIPPSKKRSRDVQPATFGHSSFPTNQGPINTLTPLHGHPRASEVFESLSATASSGKPTYTSNDSADGVRRANSTAAETGWDLNAFLLTQMTYTQPTERLPHDAMPRGFHTAVPFPHAVEQKTAQAPTPTLRSNIPSQLPSVSSYPDSAQAFDDNAMSMWLNAPSSFNVEEWGTYIANFGEFDQGQGPSL